MQVVSEQFAIGIDLGATAARVGAVDDGGRIAAVQRFPTRCTHHIDALYAAIKDAVREVQEKIGQGAADASGARPARVPIGLAIPGTLDADRRRVERSVNFPCLEDRRIADEIGAMLGGPVRLLTDAEAATWGEYLEHTVGCHAQTVRYHTPYGRKPVRFGHLRIGTGIAFGAVTDGGLLRIDSDRAQHLEALVVDRGPDAPACDCGRCGCLEAVASGRALECIARQLGVASDLSGLSDALRGHDAAAADLVSRTVDYLCSAVRRLSDAFRLEHLVLGGGVIEHLPELLDTLIDRVQAEKPIGQHGCPLVIEHARLGDSAGVVGAALLGLQATDRQRSS